MFLFFKGNIIWTCSVGPIMSLSVAFILSGGHRARLTENEHLSRYRAQFEGNLLRFVRARPYVRALLTRKSCAVAMLNAILRNYLKIFLVLMI